MFDYVVRFNDGVGRERSLTYRTYAQLREGDGITPGPEWNGPLVLVTEVMQAAYIAGAITVRAEFVERRRGRGRRSGAQRRQVAVPVVIERRSRADRRRGERRETALAL